MTILVGYASEHGSTRGIAEHLAAALRNRGLTVESRAMATIDSLDDYRGFVLGSAIHGGKWLPDGGRFIDAHKVEFGDRPVWLFSVSTLGDEESMFPDAVARKLRAMRKETSEIAAFRAGLRVRDHRNFAGAIEPSHWSAVGRGFFRVTGGRYGDHRSWKAIDAWADTIASSLAPLQPRNGPRAMRHGTD